MRVLLPLALAWSQFALFLVSIVAVAVAAVWFYERGRRA